MESVSLPDDFKDFLRFLNRHKVEYLLIGGWAVAVHGAPRYTKDLDVWVAISATNAKRVVAAMKRFGFKHGEVDESLFLEKGSIVRMGFPPMRIEILNNIDGVDFNECYSRKTIRKIGRIKIPVIGLEDLLANKRASNRPQDLADVDRLTN